MLWLAIARLGRQAWLASGPKDVDRSSALSDLAIYTERIVRVSLGGPEESYLWYSRFPRLQCSRI